jgi:hypothetical protein
MAESVQTGVQRAAQVVGAAQVAKDTEVRQSVNGVRFATFGETGVADLDLDRILEAVPAGIVSSLKANTYYFVPLAMRASMSSPIQPFAIATWSWGMASAACSSAHGCWATASR